MMDCCAICSLVRCTLQNGTDRADEGTNANGFAPPKFVHNETPEEGTEDGTAIKCRVDAANNG